MLDHQDAAPLRRQVAEQPAERLRLGLVLARRRLVEEQQLWVTGQAASQLEQPGRAGRDRVGALLERVGITAYAHERADSIPTGTARLLELARCLACDPRLLLLDEPSSGLDESETDDFGVLLAGLAQEGRAILMVEHDMDLVMAVCDTIHVLDFGQVIASGSPVEIRQDARVQQAYLGYSDGDAELTQEIQAVVS